MKHLKHLVLLPALFYNGLLLYYANIYVFTGKVIISGDRLDIMLMMGFISFAVALMIESLYKLK